VKKASQRRKEEVARHGTRIRDSRYTLNVDLRETIDLLLLDGAKALYAEILSPVESHLRPGALIVADNADYSPDCLARVRSSAKWLYVRGICR
jgi:predicted O-methyltransferase YrrM